MAPEKSRPERSRPDSFLPAKSAGWRDVAEAMAASTSARVISAEAISGDARSTCCIMLWAVAGTTDASANIPIAPVIQIDARIIVSLYLVVRRPERLLHRWQMAELIIPQGDRRGHPTINGFTAVPEQALGARRQIKGMMTLFLP